MKRPAQLSTLPPGTVFRLGGYRGEVVGCGEGGGVRLKLWAPLRAQPEQVEWSRRVRVEVVEVKAA